MRKLAPTLLASLVLAGTLLCASNARAQGARANTDAFLILLLSLLDMAQTSTVFERLALGDQKIARALFEAQAAKAPAPHLGLDQIAARKRPGEAWRDVFEAMKSEGLVADKNLGQVLSKFNEAHPDRPAAMAAPRRR